MSMSSREDILQSIRRNTRVRYEKPDLSGLEHEALTYEDKLSKFCEILKQVGGQAVILKDKENVNDVIKHCFNNKENKDRKYNTAYYLQHFSSGRCREIGRSGWY